MITREQVADLRPGDVVEYSGHRDLHGAKLVGPLWVNAQGHLVIGGHGGFFVRLSDGSPGHPIAELGDLTLTVVSRAPRPLYVNSDRTEPVPGDVVRDADLGSDTCVWLYADPDSVVPWLRRGATHGGYDWCKRRSLPARLRLLVDGTTGMPPAVTS